MTKKKKQQTFTQGKMSSAESEETDSYVLLLKFDYKFGSRLLQCFFPGFPIHLSWRVSYIIQIPLDHLDPTLVDYLSSYLSDCPIKHHFWRSVRCGSQGNTTQGSSPHKCGQKSSCSAFNVMVAAFPQIFLGSPSSRMSMIHTPITRASRKVTLKGTSLSLINPRRHSSLDHPPVYILLIRLQA